MQHRALRPPTCLAPAKSIVLSEADTQYDLCRAARPCLAIIRDADLIVAATRRLRLPCHRERPELIEKLTRINDARRTDRQAGRLQSLGRPSVAGMREVERTGRGIEDASGIGPDPDVL